SIVILHVTHFTLVGEPLNALPLLNRHRKMSQRRATLSRKDGDVTSPRFEVIPARDELTVGGECRHTTFLTHLYRVTAVHRNFPNTHSRVDEVIVSNPLIVGRGGRIEVAIAEGQLFWIAAIVGIYAPDIKETISVRRKHDKTAIG